VGFLLPADFHLVPFGCVVGILHVDGVDISALYVEIIVFYRHINISCRNYAVSSTYKWHVSMRCTYQFYMSK